MNEFLVSAEALGHDRVRLFWRTRTGVEEEDVAHKPWVLIPSNEGHVLAKVRATQLEGEGYNRRIDFDTWAAFHNTYAQSDKDDNRVMSYWQPAKNYLVANEQRLFQGAAFDDLHRCILDIETTGLDPRNSLLLMLALSDNRGAEQCWVGTEADILRSFARWIRENDPDTLEGHNLYAFDLPFIQTRAEVKGVKIGLGRDGSEARFGRTRKVMVGPLERQLTPCYVYGRHILDTYIAVQKFDSQTAKLTSYGLKAVARDYGIAEPDRIELDRSTLAELYEREPETVTTYALQDVRETLRLGNIVLPVEFFQAQRVPDNYGAVALTGSGEKWNAILVSEYLRRGQAIPFRDAPQPYIGGLVEVRQTGVLGPVVKADVESLYPSLMLTRGIKSRKDHLNVMLPMLAEMKEERLRAKRKMQACKKEIAALERQLAQADP